MTKDELLELADRCEREGASRDLDAKVLIACGHQAVNRGVRLGWEYRPNRVGIWQSMPSPTSSLDAAVTLVPEGYGWAAWHDGQARVRDNGFRGPSWESYDAKSPALALCAAALRARASTPTQGEGQ